MKLKLILFVSIFICFAFPTQVNAFLWWGEKSKPSLDQAIQDLQKQQVDSPNDPYINYNLGVALHKAGKFGQAAINFDRASIAAVDTDLKKRCFFNLGNVFYCDAVKMLPDNWATVQAPSETLDAAIAKTSQAIKKYDSVLVLDKQHEPAKINKKAAQELLEKLEKKKQDKKEQKQQDTPKADEKSQEQKQQQKDQAQNNEKTSEEKKQGKSDEKKMESMEQRGVRALLDDLQNDESKLQKALIAKKLKDEGNPQDSSQRPW